MVIGSWPLAEILYVTIISRLAFPESGAVLNARGAAERRNIMNVANLKAILTAGYAVRKPQAGKQQEKWMPVNAEGKPAPDNSILEKNTEAPENMDLMQYIRMYRNAIYDKLQKGETEESFQIGAGSYTIKEWNRMLQRFDAIEDQMREEMRAEIARRKEEAQEAKQQEKALEEQKQQNTDMLCAESTICSYPADGSGGEQAYYVTVYTKGEIYCQRKGAVGREWSIPLTDASQYQKVIAFLDGVDTKDSLYFAGHKGFWQEFLEGKANQADLMRMWDGCTADIPTA